MQLSPPYGDCTDSDEQLVRDMGLLPPYGDGMKSLESLKDLKPFSPPYGDGILNISQNTAKLKSRMARKYSLYYNDVFLR